MSEFQSSSNEDINDTVNRATENMRAYAEKPGIGAEFREKAQKKLGDIASLVVKSPDRVAYDTSAPIDRAPYDTIPSAHTGTEYDVDRAIHMADAVKPYVDARAKAQEKGKTAQAQRFDIAIQNVEKIAGQDYDANPMEAGPHSAAHMAQLYKDNNTVLQRGLFGDKVDVTPRR